MRRILVTVIAILTLCASMVVAGPPPACQPTAELEGRLAADFGERKVWVGLSQDGGMLAVWINDRSKTFTWVRTDGEMACVVAAGYPWQGFRERGRGI